MSSEEAGSASDGGLFAGKIIVIIIVVIVIAAAGAGAYFFLLNGEDADIDDENDVDGNGDENGNGNGNGSSSDIEANFFFWGNKTGVEDFVLVDERITFDGSGSKGAVHYSWDFGDGHNAYGEPMVTHYYRDPGTYTVSLNVTDGYELDYETRAVTVVQEPNVTIQETEEIQRAILPPIGVEEAKNRTGVEWFVTITTSSGNTEVMNPKYFHITLKRNNETYFNKSVVDLPVSDSPTGPEWDEDIYYKDALSTGTLSVGDYFSIAGDGGQDEPVKVGDVFSLYFSVGTYTKFLDSVTLQET